MDSEVSGATYWLDNGSGDIYNTNTGNVGIGTTSSPTEKLTVRSDTASSTSISNPANLEHIFNDSSGLADIGSGMLFSAEADDDSVVNTGQIASVFNNASSTAPQTDLRFYTRNEGDLAERMRITKEGNVGISSSTPNYDLTVNGYGYFAQPVVVGTPTNDPHAATKSYVDSTLTSEVASSTFWTLSGVDMYAASTTYNVAIGTTSPVSKLTVEGGGSSFGNLATPSEVTAATTTGGDFSATGTYYYVVAGYDSIGLSSDKSSEVSCEIESTSTACEISWSAVSRVSSYKVFGNATSSGAEDEYWSTTATSSTATGTAGTPGTPPSDPTSAYFAGNVGIGTTSPGQDLHVESNDVGIRLKRSDITETWDIKATGEGLTFRDVESGNNPVTFQHTAPTDSLYLDNTGEFYITGGNVGIGTTSPAYALDVVGYGQFAQPVTVGTPIADTHATTKSYVDSELSEATSTAENTYVNESGDTMTGVLDMDSNDIQTLGNLTTSGDLGITGGNVGIGTEGPTATLDVRGGIKFGDNADSGFDQYEVTVSETNFATTTFAGNDLNTDQVYRFTLSTRGTNADTGYVGVAWYDNNSSSWNVRHVSRSGTGSNQPYLIVDNSTVKIRTDYLDDYPVAVTVRAERANNDKYPSIFGADYMWQSVSDTLSYTEGNVGIGTDDPGSELDVYNSTSTQPVLTASDDTGTELVRIQNNGNVGIGTTSPAYALDVAGYGQFAQPVTVGTPIADTHATTKSYVDSELSEATSTAENTYVNESGDTMTGALDIQQPDTGDIFNVSSSTAGDLVTITNAGNVGIGTTEPSELLHVYEAADNSKIKIEGEGTGKRGILKLRAVTETAGKTTGDIYFTSDDDAGNATAYASIRGVMDVITDGSEAGTLELNAYKEGSRVNVMNIKSNGNVGIGTTSPAYALDVVGYGQFAQPVTVGTPTADPHATTKSYVDSELAEATSTAENTYVNESGDTMTGALDIQQPDSGDIFNISSSTAGDLVTITNDGNVGIGTTGPEYTLDINDSDGPARFAFQTNTYDAVLRIYGGSGQAWEIWNDDNAPGSQSNLLRITGDGGLNDDKMVINQDGDVGIGTTSPSQKLHVEGQCITGDSLLSVIPAEKVDQASAKGVLDVRSWILEKPIKDITSDYYAFSLNEQTGKIEPRQIKALLDMGTKPVFKLTTESGKSIKTTANHPYLALRQEDPGSLILDLSNNNQKYEQSSIQLRTAQSVAREYGLSPEELSIEQEFSQVRALWIDQSIKESSSINNAEYSGGTGQAIQDRISPVCLQCPGKSLRDSDLPKDSSQTQLSQGAGNQGDFAANSSDSCSTQRTHCLFEERQIIDDGSRTLERAEWTKVIDLAIGDYIATVKDLKSNNHELFAEGEYNKDLRSNNQDQVLWAKIESIEYVGKEQVYDIEVEDTHNFIANGILAHNTYLSSNVGIGTTSPVEKLDVDGAVKVGDTASACDVEHRGAIKFVQGAAGEADRLRICRKDLFDVYNWVAVGSDIGNFAYRKPVTISNDSSALTDYQVSVTLDTAALISDEKMQSDCADIRFIGIDGVTVSNFWLESGCNTTETKLWVKVPFVPIGSKTIYMYYGNPSASSASNGNNTFDFFDDFEGAAGDAPDTAKWSAEKKGSTAATVELDGNGNLHLAGEAGVVSSGNALSVDAVVTNAFAVEAKRKYSNEHYSDISIGDGVIQGKDGGTTQWFHPCQGDGYAWFQQALDHHIISITPSGTTDTTLVQDDVNSWGAITTWERITFTYDADGNLRWVHEGTEKLAVIDTDYLASSKYFMLSQGEYDTGAGGDSYYDWVALRNFVDPEPTTSVGTGQSGDIAEWIKYDTETQKPQPGDLVCVGKKQGKVNKCQKSYAQKIIGIVSGSPYLTMRKDLAGEDAVKLALSGRVPIKVSTENGEIKNGDLLTSASSTSGVAMEATEPGKVIGMALESYNGEETGKIIVFINPHWQGGSNLANLSDIFSSNATETLSTDNNVGIGTTTPEALLSLKNTTSTQPVFTALDDSGTELVRIENGGNVGIGTTSPSHALDVVSGDLDMNGNNITGVNKLTATTIDSLYNINGNKYSTYAPSISGGVKEEYTGNAELATKTKTGNYKYVLDFNKLPEGSDQWLWYKTVDFSENNVQVMTTPKAGFVDMYYEIKDEKIIFVGDKRIEFSYRLTGDRNDK